MTMGFNMRLWLIELVNQGWLEDMRDVDFILENDIEPSPMILAAMLKMQDKIYSSDKNINNGDKNG